MQTPTLSQTIAHQLAEDIVSGKLAFGHKLDELALAKRFDVSRTPIRDALRELTATRLIDHVPRNGFSVSSINAEQLDDIFEAATEIEALCAGLCALRARAADRTRIERIHKSGRAAAAKGDAKQYAALNEDLHSAIFYGAYNHTIESISSDIRRRLSPFRVRFFYSKARIQRSAEEHAEIVSAILAYDKDRASAAMRKHISHSAINVTAYFRQQSG
jgi:DNA-binding GntR family transcriptional regulator